MKPGKICIPCKGSRLLCGLPKCPLLAKVNVAPKISGKLSNEYFGPSFSVFVGRYGYPDVNVGPMATFNPDEVTSEDPSHLITEDYSKIVELRSSVLRSKSSENIFSKSRFINDNQELALAKKPTDVEMEFTKKPTYEVKFSDMHQPMGPTATLKKLSITENIKIDRKVEYIVNDELKASEQATKLYDHNITNYKITTILSAGTLGQEQKKKLVPTRWSITATDDILGKELIHRIKDYREVDRYYVYEAEHLANHFVIILLPGPWEYENFEAWSPNSFWGQYVKEATVVGEYEPYKGRTTYAEGQGGGYYAARLGALEGLHSIKRQARVLSFREISDGYQVPLGVWVVRETARNALKSDPHKFDTLDQTLKYVRTQLNIPLSTYKRESQLLKQRKLTDFAS